MIATITAVSAALLIGTGVATWQAIRATHERSRAVLAEAAAEEQARRADQEADRANREAEKARTEADVAKAVNEFLNKDLLAQANPFLMPEQDVSLREVVDLASEKLQGRFDDQPLVEATIHQTLAETYSALGEDDKREHHSRQAYEIRRRILGQEDLNTLESFCSLGRALYRQHQLKQSEELARRLMAILEKLHKTDTILNAQAVHLLGLSLHSQGRIEDAARSYRMAIDKQGCCLLCVS